MRGPRYTPHALAAATAAFLVAAVVVVLSVAVGPMRVVQPAWFDDSADDPPPPAGTPMPMPSLAQQTPPPESATADSRSIEIPWSAALVAILVIAAVLAYVLMRRLRSGGPDRGLRTVVGGSVDEPLDASEELRAAARAAGVALSGTRTTGPQAVIEAWLALENAAAGTGVARDPAQTPSEFTAALLRRHHADDAATSTLLALYHRARFSPRPDIDDSDVDDARAALRAILHTLAPRAGAGAGPS